MNIFEHVDFLCPTQAQFEHPCVAEGIPAHGRGVEWDNPELSFQTTVKFCELILFEATADPVSSLHLLSLPQPEHI